MVSSLRPTPGLRALMLALACSAQCACSAFDPVEPPRFERLAAGNNPKLAIKNAHWVAYDDQHSLTGACTNGATGNHDASLCSLLYDPWFGWDGPKCLSGERDLSKGDIADPGVDGLVCVQGVLRPFAPCDPAGVRCLDTTNNNEFVDASNMWGAGVGLAFTGEDGKGWNADLHGAVGVSFDLTGIDDADLGAKALNLRVEVPIELDGSRPLPDQPVMRDDGSVIGTDKKLYRYECDSRQVSESELPSSYTGQLSDVLSGTKPRLLTSELHPLGSPFWQPGSPSAWVPSPVHAGHNEFEFGRVLAPKDSGYDFHDTAIVGIHFQVVHADSAEKVDRPFAFCISNLALLMK